MTRASATLSKSCATIRSSRVKPLRSSNMSDRCHSLRWITGSICTRSIQQRRRRKTYCFMLSPFCLDKGPPGRQYWRNSSLVSRSDKGKNIPRICWISVSIPCGIPSTISHRLSKPTYYAATNASPRNPSQTFDIASM